MLPVEHLAEPYTMNDRKNDEDKSTSTRNDKFQFKTYTCIWFVCKMDSKCRKDHLSMVWQFASWIHSKHLHFDFLNSITLQSKYLNLGTLHRGFGKMFASSIEWDF